MQRLRRRSALSVGFISLLILWAPSGAEGQLAAPAREAADELLTVVRTGDRARIRAFIEERFASDFINSLPMDHHVPIFASLGRQVEDLRPEGVTLDGPTRVSMILKGPGKRLELRLRVQPKPPHRIKYLGWGDAGPDIEANSLTELDSELERLAARPPFSGVVLVAKGPDVLFHRAYGSADLEAARPNRPNTRFDIGSIGKLFTSTVVLRLVEDGQLDLDDPLGTYLDGFSAKVAERVTIRHLLQHRSGFGDYLSHPEFTANPKQFREVDDFLPLARGQALAFEPGERRAYSNMGFVVLGAIIERVTGRGYHEVVDEVVFGPAEMASTGPMGGPSAAVPYELEDGRFVSTDSLYPDVGTPAGGGVATAMDLRRFFDALLDYRLLSEEMTSLLLNAFEPPAEAEDLPERVGFAGGAAGINALVLSRPPERTVVVVLANIDPIEVEAIGRRIERIVGK